MTPLITQFDLLLATLSALAGLLGEHGRAWLRRITPYMDALRQVELILDQLRAGTLPAAPPPPVQAVKERPANPPPPPASRSNSSSPSPMSRSSSPPPPGQPHPPPPPTQPDLADFLAAAPRPAASSAPADPSCARQHPEPERHPAPPFPPVLLFARLTSSANARLFHFVFKTIIPQTRIKPRKSSPDS